MKGSLTVIGFGAAVVSCLFLCGVRPVLSDTAVKQETSLSVIAGYPSELRKKILAEAGFLINLTP